MVCRLLTMAPLYKRSLVFSSSVMAAWIDRNWRSKTRCFRSLSRILCNFHALSIVSCCSNASPSSWMLGSRGAGSNKTRRISSSRESPAVEPSLFGRPLGLLLANRTCCCAFVKHERRTMLNIFVSLRCQGISSPAIVWPNKIQSHNRSSHLVFPRRSGKRGVVVIQVHPRW